MDRCNSSSTLVFLYDTVTRSVFVPTYEFSFVRPLTFLDPSSVFPLLEPLRHFYCVVWVFFVSDI